MSHSQDFLIAIEKIRASVDGVLKQKLSWFDKLKTIITVVVPEVEAIGQQGETVAKMSGADKKALAMEIIDEVWFRYLDIKYIPNFIEKIIIKNASSKLIDLVVDKFNKMGIFKHA